MHYHSLSFSMIHGHRCVGALWTHSKNAIMKKYTVYCQKNVNQKCKKCKCKNTMQKDANHKCRKNTSARARLVFLVLVLDFPWVLHIFRNQICLIGPWSGLHFVARCLHVFPCVLFFLFFPWFFFHVFLRLQGEGGQNLSEVAPSFLLPPPSPRLPPCQLVIAVGIPTPQLPVHDCNGHRRTSTGSSGSLGHRQTSTTSSRSQ